MLKILEAFNLSEPDALKRALVALLGGVTTLAVNPILVKNGYAPVSDIALGSFAGLLSAFLLQSGIKAGMTKAADAKAAGEVAAAAVTTPEDAAKVLGAP